MSPDLGTPARKHRKHRCLSLRGNMRPRETRLRWPAEDTDAPSPTSGPAPHRLPASSPTNRLCWALPTLTRSCLRAFALASCLGCWAPDAHMARSPDSLTGLLKSHLCPLATALKCQPPPSPDTPSFPTHCTESHRWMCLNVHRDVRPSVRVRQASSPLGCREKGFHVFRPLLYRYSAWNGARSFGAWQHSQEMCHRGSRRSAHQPPARPHDGSGPTCLENLPSGSGQKGVSHLGSKSKGLCPLSAHEYGPDRPQGAQSLPACPQPGPGLTTATRAASMDPMVWGLGQGLTAALLGS